MIVVIGETKKHLTSATNNSKFWQSWPLGQFLVELLHIIRLRMNRKYFRHFLLQLEERNASVRSGIWHLHLTFKNTFTVFGVHQVGWRGRQGKFVEMLIWVEAATVWWRLFHLATSEQWIKEHLERWVGAVWGQMVCCRRRGQCFTKHQHEDHLQRVLSRERERNGSNVVTQHGFARISHILTLLWFWNK